MATRYVVQVYERYAIYEPAEGGYYYEGYLRGGADGLWAGSRNHRYIGEGYEVYVEPLKMRGCHAKGREPYC